MAKATLKCSKCTRKFSMPAHLQRHMNAIHKPKKRGRPPLSVHSKKVRARVGRPKGVRSKAATRPKLNSWRRAGASGDGASRLLGEMRTYRSALLAERSLLESRMTALTRAMAALGATTPAGSRRRAAAAPKRGRPAGGGIRRGSLKDHILRVLRQTAKPLGPRDISARVLKMGFKTNAKDIAKAVSNKLPELKSVRKVGFGLYKIAAS